MANRKPIVLNSSNEWEEIASGDGIAQSDITGLVADLAAKALLAQVTTGITAQTPQTQGNGALTLNAGVTTLIAVVATVTTSGDVITLPGAAAGLGVLVINRGSNTLQVWPASGDTLDTADLSTTITAGASRWFQSYDSTVWIPGLAAMPGGGLFMPNNGTPINDALGILRSSSTILMAMCGTSVGYFSTRHGNSTGACRLFGGGLGVGTGSTAPARPIESVNSAGPQVRGSHTMASKYWELGIDTNELVTLYNAARQPVGWTAQNVQLLAAVLTAPTVGVSGKMGLWYDSTAATPKIILPDNTVKSVTVGPTTTVDNTLTRYDGTAGAVQTSLAKLDDAGCLWLPNQQSADPTSSLGTGSYLYPKSVAVTTENRRTLTFRQSSDPAYAGGLQTALWQHQIARINPVGAGSTNFPPDGLDALSTVGTVTGRALSAASPGSDLGRASRVGFVSAGTAGSVAGCYETVRRWATRNLYFCCHFGISDASLVSGARMFVGLKAAVTAPIDEEPGTLLAGVAQLSTDSTQFYFMRGGNAEAATIGTPFAPALNTVYRLEMFSDTTTRFTMVLTNLSTGASISRGSENGHAAFNVYYAFACWRSNGATAAAVGVDLCGAYFEKNYL